MDLVQVNSGLSTEPKFITLLDRVYSVFSGFDKPRYIDWSTSRSGKLGMYAWSTDYWYRPSGSVASGGSLTDTKWYSIRVVAVDKRYASKDGSYKVSNAGPISDAVQASSPDLTIDFTLPAHPDTGFEPDGAGGLTETAECQERWIYACESDTEDGALLGPWNYVGKVENNTDNATYSLTAFAAGGDVPYSDKYPPPNSKVCISAFGRIWSVGGIDYSEGQAYYRNASEAETISGITNTDAQENIYRYTFSAAPSIDVYRGSLLTVTGCDNAGNDVTKTKVLRVADDKTWVEISNADGTAETPSGSPSGTVIQNHIEGDSDAAFYDGMEQANFRFDATGEKEWLVEKVNATDNVLLLDEEYTGSISADTATDFEVTSTYGLYWSAVDNPHSYPAANYMELDGIPTALSNVNDRLLIFTESDVLVVGIEFLNEGYWPVAGSRGTPSPGSVVTANGMVYYWNGKRFMKCNGGEVAVVAQHKADNVVEDISPSYEHLMTGAFDPSRNVIRWMWTEDGEVTNNTGLEVNLQNEDVWPIRQWDVNLLWNGYNPDTGTWNLWHGGSGRYTYNSKSYFYEHKESVVQGALPSGCATIAVVSAVASNYFDATPYNGSDSITYASVDGTTTKNEGIPFLVLAQDDSSETGGLTSQMYASPLGTGQRIVAHSDFDLSSVSVGDLVLLGCIPMDYGIKWVDFDSPRYRHHVYDLDLQFRNLEESCLIAVDWFTDMNETRIKTEMRYIESGVSKQLFSFKMGKPYIVGFKIRVYGPAKFQLQHYSLTWATIR